MKNNKTIFILMIVPFVVGLLSFVSVQIAYNTVASDISDIKWDYDESEGFKVRSEGYLLHAEAVVDDSLLLAPGNDLEWSLRDLSSEGIAKIEQNENGDYYLYALQEGNCQVVCSNQNKTKSKYFQCYTFNNGAIVISPSRAGSGERIDSERYYGEYDLSYNSLSLDSYSKVYSSYDVSVKLFGDQQGYTSSAVTDNIEVHNNHISFKGYGEAIARFTSTSMPYGYVDYSFNIVHDAVNVYSYNDLLMATNFSSLGEVIVMQSNLESLKNTYEYNDATNSYNKVLLKENTALFGNYNFDNKSFSFKNELYKFESTYETSFIDQYNLEKATAYNKDVNVGIHLQKDLYGNGFTINAHELCFPNHGKIGSNGKLIPDKKLDYFFGPLPYMTIGNLFDQPIVKAYGQDNIGLYVDGDNITINDIRMKNTNEIDNMYNLTYTGSVIEARGSNIVLKNSVVSNGRTVLRSFDCPNLLVSNCILKNANEFIATFGSNKINSYDTSKNVTVNVMGETITDSFTHFYDSHDTNSYSCDSILNTIMSQGAISDGNVIAKAQTAMDGIQQGLVNLDGIYDGNRVTYDYEATFKNTSFYNSGVFSIAFESLFNGPYLYDGTPSLVSHYTAMFNSVIPSKIGGTSHPVKLHLDETNSFYDWKDIDTIDVSSLVEENISKVVNDYLGTSGVEISIDDLYPIKPVLKDLCRSNRYIYASEGKKYINTKVAWYGGGLNLSSLELYESKDMSNRIEVDLISPMLSNKYAKSNNSYMVMASKAILMATGFNPFQFITNGEITNLDIPDNFGEVPTIESLIKNA